MGSMREPKGAESTVQSSAQEEGVGWGKGEFFAFIGTRVAPAWSLEHCSALGRRGLNRACHSLTYGASI